MDKKLIKANHDTAFLKLIGCFCMAADHFGKTLCPELVILQIIGRIAFPIFAYCTVVGVLYTRSFKNYIKRLFVFALISQIPYTLAFYPSWEGFLRNFYKLNILFTLLTGAVMVKGMSEKKLLWVILSAAAFVFLPLDYGAYCIPLFAVFYLFRNSRLYGITAMALIMSISFVTKHPSCIQGFAILALPFIYADTNFYPRINRGVFYVFYPLHLLLIFSLRILI